MASELLQVRAAALKLGVHENTLRSWEKAGLLPAVRLPSGVRRFRVEDIDRMREEMYEAVGSQDRALAAAAPTATTARGRKRAVARA
jgi:predicted site-specific integrase-resolvase